MSEAIAFNPIYLPENKGLGNALREALINCKYDLVARMDSDDISAPFRFEKQLEVFCENPTVDIVGGSITEFVGEPDNITGERTVQLTDDNIKADMKKRCAMNHVTVMYKKDSVQAAGGYEDWHYNEDYYLWIRMMEHGCNFANVPYPLVNVRTGEDMSARRGGWRYFKSEQTLQKYMLDHKLISIPRYIYNVALRFGGEVVASNSLRQRLFKMMRKEYNPTQNGIFNVEQGMDAIRKYENYPQFSVATSVYKNDNPEWFDTALESIIVKQTVKPSEVVLVVDGPVPEGIQHVINKYAELCKSGGGYCSRLSDSRRIGD
ncbi:MAG: glycosyltransferase [Eubacterium sp.]|nr:glycosyltransferase [Eubacterium sp.]